MELINGKEISEKIKNDLKEEIKHYMIKPCLVVIQIGNNEASNIYIKSKEKASLEIGLNFRHFLFEETTSEQEIINKIIELNNDEYVDGIIVQLPLPEKYNQKRILNQITASKDVDGLSDLSQAKLVSNRPCFIPCTPSAVISLLEEKEIEIEGKNVTIIGRSNLVGKPLLNLMLNKNATVTVCHSKTKNLKEHTKNADILICAVGQKHLITENMVKEGAVVIDIGINREEGKIYGDVDFDNVSKHTSYITPVPGGVGPMTVTMLLKNTIDSYKKRITSK